MSTDLAATRAFFGPRAAEWEIKFPDDAPRYRQAVAELAPPVGGAVADIACGTGRALPELRDAVGPGGAVFGIDVTVEMLAEAAARGRDKLATLVLADAMRLPFPTARLDALFAAGLLAHLADPRAGLAELARVCRPGGRLAVFHPIGRAALARRQGRELSADDLRAEPNIRAALAATGWHCDSVDDGEDRYLVLATRAR
ncbi:class I SAM-dependent methyltransferase [Amycolatopsis alkalitolerans]|uniref:Methyltransferase domain-containing protein n=1 Tax=Amycolatopsis alkalitolerans TaxID=2547244 RepID=A0A5C4LYP3_9PSEU|nr:methyltransferase domain-containing protein [Amycolatopsis alkalitolerans]TNC24892.1 methyltransferase domain-containing protein [Amycolatopsis alkalitolerans]